MKPRTLAILALVVAALGAFIWFYERELPSSERRAELQKRVFALEAKDIHGIAIEANGQRVRLERDAASAAAADGAARGADTAVDAVRSTPPADRPWRLAEPLQGSADRAAADRLADTLAALDKQRTLENADRKDLGLEVPRAKVTLQTTQGERVLEIGSAIPASSSMAVATPGSPDAYVVANGLFTDISKAPGDWRAHELFPGQRDAIERVTLTSPAGSLLLAKRDDTFWLESPVVDRADRDLTGGLLSDILALRAESFLDAPGGAPGNAPARPLAELGLDPPQARVEVVLQGQEQPFRLEVGNPVGATGDRRYARVGEQLVEAEIRLLPALGRAAAEWRSPLLSGMEVYRVDAAELTDAAGTVKVERAGPDWKRTVGDHVETIPFTPVSDLLYALTSARATRIVDRAEASGLGANLAKPSLSAVLTASDKSTESLSLYPVVAGTGAPATVTGREAILLLSKETAEDVAGKLETLRKTEPLPEKQDADRDEGL